MSEQTLHRGCSPYGGMEPAGPTRPRDVKNENVRRKQFAAASALDLNAMREVVRMSFGARDETAAWVGSRHVRVSILASRPAFVRA